MHTLYVVDTGVSLKKRGDRIAVKKGGKIADEFPTRKLKRVLIFGNNQVSTGLMKHLAGLGVEVAFLSGGGRFLYRLVPNASKNIYLRIAQYDRFRDPAFRLEWSRTVVGAKIRNQRGFLLRARRNRPDADIGETIDLLGTLAEKPGEKSTVEEVMGVEGFAARSYFSAFGRLLSGGFEFRGRAFHPPPDPVNALLSFGYMMLFNEISSLLEAFGFDIYLGFLHSIAQGRASLATDMMEEFRSPVVDRLTVYLINLGVVRPEQFSPGERGGVRMDDAARKAYVKNFEKFMTAEFTDNRSREQTSFREMIRRNVSGLEKLLLEGEPYRPFRLYS